jgi:two-component system, sensor histidine kinase and response regulator
MHPSQTTRTARLLSSARRKAAAVAIQPDDVDRRKRERAVHLATVEIPLLRAVGSAFLSLGVYLNNRYFLGETSIVPWLEITAVLAAYCVVSTVIIRLFYERAIGVVDLSLVFLILDVPVWTLAIYASGAERSWLFFVLLMRVADQTQTTFRRCLALALWAALCYGALLLWVMYVDHRSIDPAVIAVKLVFLAISGLYIALIARTAEARRAQMGGVIRVSRDLIRQLEDYSVAVREARSRAEAASAAKSEFLANMSHEMRTPLHGILGMLQLVRDGETSPRRIRQLDLAKHSAEALLATIDDILDFAKIEARKIELEPVYFGLRELLMETMKPLGVTAAQKGLSLAYLVEQDAPETLWGDPLRLRQILVNLVGNAIKFTPAGEIALHVIRVASDDRRVILQFDVRDTGIGIDPEKTNAIFQPFTQADSSHSRRFGGTGLGLAIVARLVEAMGGSIAVSSHVGKGSAFTFSVTMETDRAHAEPRREPWESALAGKRILVAESNATARAYIATMLRAHGMIAEEVPVLTKSARSGFDCTITSGNEVARAPVIRIVSPLTESADDRLQITRPVAERELLDTLGIAFGLVETIARQAPAPQVVADRPLRVLVAEDNIVNQEFASETLQRMGHNVVVASDGREALDRLRDDTFDLVLMDVQMPDLDGLEVTRRARARGVRTKIYALTAHTRREDRDRCIDAGMDGVLTKPIDPKQLGDVLRATVPMHDPIMQAVDGNRRLLARVNEAFARQTPAAMETIRKAIERRDADALYHAAHKLKGSVSNFPGVPAIELAISLEHAARESDFEQAQAVAPLLENAVRDLGKRIESALTM